MVLVESYRAGTNPLPGLVLVNSATSLTSFFVKDFSSTKSSRRFLPVNPTYGDESGEFGCPFITKGVLSTVKMSIAPGYKYLLSCLENAPPLPRQPPFLYAPTNTRRMPIECFVVVRDRLNQMVNKEINVCRL